MQRGNNIATKLEQGKGTDSALDARMVRCLFLFVTINIRMQIHIYTDGINVHNARLYAGSVTYFDITCRGEGSEKAADTAQITAAY